MLDKVIGEGEFGRVMSGRLLEKSLASGTFETTFIIHPRDHPFKMSAYLRGEGCPLGPMVKRSHYIRIKNPLHKHFAEMPMIGGVGVKNRENLLTS